jgi:hypothetical protein
MERILKENWKDFSPFKNIIGVEMQNGNKYYLVPNVDGFVPVNLKQHIDCGYSSVTDLESGMPECSIIDGNKKVYRFDSIQEVINWATS